MILTVVVSFNQSSYEVMEDDGTVSLVIALSQPSSVPFQATINMVDMTAVGKYVRTINRDECLRFLVRDNR